MNNNDDPLKDLQQTKNGATIMMWTRTVIYILGLCASIVSFVIDTYGQHQLAQIIALVGAFVTSIVGVAYNPVRMNNIK